MSPNTFTEVLHLSEMLILSKDKTLHFIWKLPNIIYADVTNMQMHQ